MPTLLILFLILQSTGPIMMNTNRIKICSKDYVCIFMKTVQQVRAFIREVDKYNNPPKIGGKVRKIVNTNIGLRAYLVQKQLDRILTILSEQQSTSIQVANHLKQHLTQKFTELRSYFEQVDTFNQRIAQADIGFIDGRLDTFRSERNQISVTMKRDLKLILESAITIAAGDVRQRIIELAVALTEPIYFKIPNSQWLVDRGWIVSSEKKFAFYVKQFEVFLPTASSFARRVQVRALPITNEVVPGGTDYSITPSSSLVYEYKEGPPNTQCRFTKDKHPYMACKTSGYNEICHLTVVVNRIAYPSLFAR